MRRVFIDTNIPMYAAGTPHPLREPARRVILAIANDEIDAWMDAEVFQEILYRYIHIGKRAVGFQIFDHFYELMRERILPVDAEDLMRSRKFAERYPHLSPRDLIHLAVMVRHHLLEIVTTDKGFDQVQEVRRVDPSRLPDCLGKI